MLLAGLILLAACANLGSLFAARAADRSREVALRLALGSRRTRILRTLFTEAVVISPLGGAIGLWGSVMLLHRFSVWRPLPAAPLNVPVYADDSVYLVALLLALGSGLLFGAVPVRQILRTNPYEIVKLGSSPRIGRRITVRDFLLVVQVAICAVLVTSSLVAVRGLVRSLHSNFGFEPRNTLLVETALSMAGYSGDSIPVMQKRMIDALETIPGAKSVGAVDRPPLFYGANGTHIFSDKTTDLRPANAMRAVKLLAIGSVTGLLLGILASRVLAFIVYQATPRDPMVLGGVVLAMALLGLAATWIPARRALSVNPLVLLREE
jgi:predicted lysophospholipase L1 biosynthesis ABC-type transport system permease subunit